MYSRKPCASGEVELPVERRQLNTSEHEREIFINLMMLVKLRKTQRDLLLSCKCVFVSMCCGCPASVKLSPIGLLTAGAP